MKFKVKWITALLMTAMLILNLAVLTSASLIPDSLYLEDMIPGESVIEEKDIVITIPLKVDVVFAFDLTGSMSGEIGMAKTKAQELMNSLNALSDFKFGVISYTDYPNYYTSYGYSSQYGWAVSGDYAYNLDQALTDNTIVVNSAITGLALGDEGDGPQDYTRIFYESYADTSTCCNFR